MYRVRKYYLFLCYLLIINIQGFSQNRYALIIGISGYPNFRQEDRLEFADNDATEFASFIQTPSGGNFHLDNIKLITNQDANRTGITNGIRWLKMRSNSNDLVYIFFAGHGLVDDVGHAYFMPYEGDQSDPAALGFRADRFLEDIRTQVNYKHMIFFTDACHAGAIYSQGIARDGAQNIVSDIDQAWKNLFRGKEEITMAFLSTASNQRSWEDTSIKHGLFTYYLIKGLKGEADGAYNGEKDNNITAIELYHFLLNKVENHALRLGKTQTPTKSPTFLPDFPFAMNTNSQLSKENEQPFETAYSYNVQGWKLLYEGKFYEGIESFEKSIEINPNYSDSYNFAGVGYFLIGNCNKAFEYLKLALKYDSTSAGVYHNLGLLYGECSFDFKKAYEYTLKSHEMMPQNTRTLSNLSGYSLFIDKNEYSLSLSARVREILKSLYNNEDRFFYRDDFSIEDKQDFINSHLYSAINSLILNDNSNFEIYYNNVITLYNNYPDISIMSSYESLKHFVIESTSLENQEKKLLIQLFNLLDKEKSKDHINEFNLSIPKQYNYLKKPVYSD